jgi:hypothetical protein
MPEEEFLGRVRGGARRLLEEQAEKGRTVWVSFDWVLQVNLQTAFEQQERLSGLGEDRRRLVIKTAALEEAIEGWPATELRRALASHSAIILASEEGLSMIHSTPMQSP